MSIFATLTRRVCLWSALGLVVGAPLVVTMTALALIFPDRLGEIYTGILLVAQAILLVLLFTLFFLLFVVHRIIVPVGSSVYRPLKDSKVNIGLTAYNDESSIGLAVDEFRKESRINVVIVVDNNSQDRTELNAREAQADRVVVEKSQGYGACCMRALREAAQGLDDRDVIVLCEGDMTFVARDIPKFLAYLENCDLVLGTRATQELREAETQMDWLINPINQIMAKLIQVRFWGTRLTDVGCTYRALRVSTYTKLCDKLHVTGNHFSPHMFIEALKLNMRVIEIPVVFRKRVGLSKGVGTDKLKAAWVALAMLGLLLKA